MEHLKTTQELNESQENSNISDVMSSILNDLEYEKNNYEEPSSYMEDEYYIRCKAKAEAFEEAINIVKKYYS